MSEKEPEYPPEGQNPADAEPITPELPADDDDWQASLEGSDEDDEDA